MKCQILLSEYEIRNWYVQDDFYLNVWGDSMSHVHRDVDIMNTGIKLKLLHLPHYIGTVT
jgi:hypothetical protein